MKIVELMEQITTAPGAVAGTPAQAAAGTSVMQGGAPQTPADIQKQKRRDDLQKQIAALQVQINRLQSQQAGIK